MRYSATTTINASPDTIWAILADAAGYPDWDPGIDHVEGTLAPGESVKFFTVIDPSRAFAVKVTTFEPGSQDGAHRRHAHGPLQVGAHPHADTG